MKIDMTDEQLETVIDKAYNEGYKRGYQDGVQHIKNVVDDDFCSWGEKNG